MNIVHPGVLAAGDVDERIRGQTAGRTGLAQFVEVVAVEEILWADRIIDPNAVLILVDRGALGVSEVEAKGIARKRIEVELIRRRWQVRRQKCLDDADQLRIEAVCRNDIAGEGLNGSGGGVVGRRIVDDAVAVRLGEQGAEVAAKLGRRRQRRVALILLRVAVSFVVRKEEDLVLPDRTAERAAKLVLFVPLLRRRRTPVRAEEVTSCVERGILDELIRVAVELVRSGLGGNAHRAAGCSAELRSCRVRLLLELLDHVGGRTDRVDGVRRVRRHDAVDEEQVAAVGGAADRRIDRARADLELAAILRDSRRRHAGNQLQQLDELAPVQRKIGDLLGLDDGAQRNVVDVEQRR